MITLYLAGGLFNIAERTRNIFLAKALRKLAKELAIELKIISPQEEALKYFEGGTLNLDLVSEACADHCRNSKNICVANIDGPSADDGTSVEFGLAHGSTGRAIAYRTDLRYDPEREIGKNAMFRIRKTEFVYCPCTITEESEIEAFYDKLAKEIYDAVIRLINKKL